MEKTHFLELLFVGIRQKGMRYLSLTGGKLQSGIQAGIKVETTENVSGLALIASLQRWVDYSKMYNRLNCKGT
jgi:hypothetical protein